MVGQGRRKRLSRAGLNPGGSRGPLPCGNTCLEQSENCEDGATAREVSLHSAEQQMLGYQGKAKSWGRRACVRQSQGLTRSRLLTSPHQVHRGPGVQPDGHSNSKSLGPNT